MDGELSKYLIINQRFNDFEVFAQITKLWNLDFRQIDRGAFEAELVQIASPDLQVSKGTFNRKLDQIGTAPKGLRTFGMLTDHSTPTSWRGDMTYQQQVIIFPKDGEFEAVSNPGLAVFTASYSEELLLDVVETLGVSEPQDILRDPEVLPVDPKKLQFLRRTISKLLSDIQLNSLHMTEVQMQYEVEYEIPRALILSLLKESRYEKKPSPQSRYITVKRVREYIESNTYGDITVRDLCRVAGVSERTLRYAFEENLCVSPKAFVNMIRLNRVRRDLRRTNPENKCISDIANRWGFWHLGQFASDYRKLFGELPSETKRGISIAGF